MTNIVIPTITVGDSVRTADPNLVSALTACQLTMNGGAEAGGANPNLTTALREMLGVNDASVTRRNTAEVTADQATTSTSPVDLVGPSFTVAMPASGGILLVSARAEHWNPAGGGNGSRVHMSITGAPGTPITMSTNIGIIVPGTVFFYANIWTLTTGTKTVKFQFSAVTGGTANFRNCYLRAIALGF